MKYIKISVSDENRFGCLIKYFQNISMKIPESSYGSNLFYSFGNAHSIINNVKDDLLSAVEINGKLYVVDNLKLNHDGVSISGEEITPGRFFSIFFAHYPKYLNNVGFMYCIKDVKTGDILYTDYSLKNSNGNVSTKNYFPVKTDISRRYLSQNLNLSFDVLHRKIKSNTIDDALIKAVDMCPLIVANTTFEPSNKYNFSEEPVIVSASDIINERFKCNLKSVQMERMLNKFIDRSIMKTNADCIRLFIDSCYSGKIKLPDIEQNYSKDNFDYKIFSSCRPEILIYTLGFSLEDVSIITGRSKKDVAVYLYELAKNEEIDLEMFFKKSVDKAFAEEIRVHYQHRSLSEVFDRYPDQDPLNIAASYLYADYVTKRINYNIDLRNNNIINKSVDKKVQLMNGIDFVKNYSDEIKLSREPLMSMNFEMNNNFNRDKSINEDFYRYI